MANVYKGLLNEALIDQNTFLKELFAIANKKHVSDSDEDDLDESLIKAYLKLLIG
jgi:hypothetical protein